MCILVKILANKRSVIFDNGRFDRWCVYVKESDGSKKAPLDVEYFQALKQISKKYPDNKVYEDFVAIYNQTTKSIQPDVIALIDEKVSTYADTDKNIVEQWFTVIYAAMIAEENKKNTILKKRIKHLGIYQLLVLDMPAKEAARFSFGKKWHELDAMMRSYGIP